MNNYLMSLSTQDKMRGFLISLWNLNWTSFLIININYPPMWVAFVMWLR